jgi:hypothetical protein
MSFPLITSGPYQGMMESTISFCEGNENSYIAQPVNTWTNLAYVFIGVVLVYIARKEKVPFLKVFAILPIIIGIFSFMLHATNSFLGGSLDLASMFLFSSLLLTNNLYRLYLVKHAHFIQNYLFINFLFLVPHFLILYITRLDIGSHIFALQVAVIIVTEIILVTKRKYQTEIHDLLISLTLIGIAISIWLLDIYRVWCDARSYHIINGHGIWHILTALSFVPLYFYYHQFYVRRGKWHSRNEIIRESVKHE